MSDFETVYQLAKAKNSHDLWQKACARGYIWMNVIHEGHTPVSRLAYEGDNAAVELLVNQFQADERWAIYGFALGGHVKQVELILAKERTGWTIDHQYHELRKWATLGFAQGKHVEEVNKIISQECKPKEREELLKELIVGFDRGGLLTGDEETLLKLISHIDDIKLRVRLVLQAKKRNMALDENVLSAKAEKLHQLMKEHQMDYAQAQDWIQAWALPEKERVWLLLGSKLVHDKAFPREMAIHLLSCSFGLSYEDTKKRVNNFNNLVFKSLYESSIRNCSQAFFGRPFGGSSQTKANMPTLKLEEYLEEQKQAADRYKSRII